MRLHVSTPDANDNVLLMSRVVLPDGEVVQVRHYGHGTSRAEMRRHVNFVKLLRQLRVEDSIERRSSKEVDDDSFGE